MPPRAEPGQIRASGSVGAAAAISAKSPKAAAEPTSSRRDAPAGARDERAHDRADRHRHGKGGVGAGATVEGEAAQQRQQYLEVEGQEADDAIIASGISSAGSPRT